MKAAILLALAAPLAAQTGAEWTTYHGTPMSQHYSTLAQLTPANVANLELKWVWQAQSMEKFEATPLIINGVMYFSEAPNNVVAVDPQTGREYWVYEHKLPEVTYNCCGKVNRGVAFANGMIFLATLDMKIIALDAATGQKRWEVTVDDYHKGYALTHAPLIVKDKIIIGTAGGELGIQGYIAAYDVETGKQRWRFNTVPHPGEPGNETWGKDAKGNDSWKHGGASIWLTGSYDPQLNLTYWGTGNPGPDWNASMRPGDNLYSDSVVALDADTGKLKWHFQFTPHDEWDFDSVQTPVLIDANWKGAPRKLMLWGNRNAFYYVLDRATGEFLHGSAFAKQNWAQGLDAKGRPIKAPGRGPSVQGTLTFPGVQGSTNWYSPSFNPNTGLFYLSVWDDYSGTYYSWDQTYEQGKWFAGGAVQAEVPAVRRLRINRRDPKNGYGAVRALRWDTGEKVWEYRMGDVTEGGILTTASNLLFTGNREGHFLVLDARDGKVLFRKYLGGQTAASPVTYMVNGKQYISLAIGHSLFTFGLKE